MSYPPCQCFSQLLYKSSSKPTSSTARPEHHCTTDPFQGRVQLQNQPRPSLPNWQKQLQYYQCSNWLLHHSGQSRTRMSILWLQNVVDAKFQPSQTQTHSSYLVSFQGSTIAPFKKSMCFHFASDPTLTWRDHLSVSKQTVAWLYCSHINSSNVIIYLQDVAILVVKIAASSSQHIKNQNITHHQKASNNLQVNRFQNDFPVQLHVLSMVKCQLGNNFSEKD